MYRLNRLDIQTKIILVLVAVIVPTSLVVTVVQNRFLKPVLHNEIRQLGMGAAATLATKIAGHQWLKSETTYPAIENEIQEILYLQPTVQRMDVLIPDPATGKLRIIASNVVEETAEVSGEVVDNTVAEFTRDEGGPGMWSVLEPILNVKPGQKNPPKPLGMVRVLVSTHPVSRLLAAFFRINWIGTLASVVILVLVLTFFLRKTIFTEQRLRAAEDKNLQLAQQLQDTQRQLMNVEKLAVMGQLTANFAHEIGTPLNAISGHLELLKDNTTQEKSKTRLEIISGEVTRIEKIVKGFLQTTAKPISQTQLVDLNKLVDQTAALMKPRLESLGINLDCRLNRKLGPVRVVPLEIEQILLNLVNNSVDSLETKLEKKNASRLNLRITSKTKKQDGKEWAEISVYDTGMGIKRDDLGNVKKPFFTTKRPGEGTGLGLTISQQLANKYGGHLEIDSREGSWAEVTLALPYRNGGEDAASHRG